jgi:hypothetical protein
METCFSEKCGVKRAKNRSRLWRKSVPIPGRLNYWEIIGDNLSKAGWSWACLATVNSRGQTIFIAGAHRDDGKRCIARG